MGLCGTRNSTWEYVEVSIEAADVLDHLVGSPQGCRLLVAVDGVDASGKTTFAEWLAEALRLRGRSAQVIHVDDFMHVRSVRHRRGRNSPEGYFHDSYDYESLTRYVLEPLTASGDGWFRAGTVDRLRDVVIRSPLQYADVADHLTEMRRTSVVGSHGHPIVVLRLIRYTVTPVDGLHRSSNVVSHPIPLRLVTAAPGRRGG
jgi:hypothetical protein